MPQNDLWLICAAITAARLPRPGYANQFVLLRGMNGGSPVRTRLSARTLGPGLNGDWAPRSIGSHHRWMPSVGPGRALPFPSDLKRCRLGEVAADELHQ
jgi:hypothetical protein